MAIVIGRQTDDIDRMCNRSMAKTRSNDGLTTTQKGIDRGIVIGRLCMAAPIADYYSVLITVAFIVVVADIVVSVFVVADILSSLPLLSL